MRTTATLERYYVLPCCLLLLNLCNEIIAYKVRLIDDGLLRTLCIMGFVLFGASLVAFAIPPYNCRNSAGRRPCSRRVRRARASWRLARRTPFSSVTSGQ